MTSARKTIFQIIASVLVVTMIGFFVIDGVVRLSTEDQIITLKEAQKLNNVDGILVLGAGVNSNGSPSPMLRDRLLTSIEIYQKGITNKIIMSGDHGREDYDEVNVMKQFAMDKNIPSEDIFMDHAGFSTYESLYRAKEIFQAKTIIIVTQNYHLPRALYLAKALGLNAYGISADKQRYRGQGYRNVREMIARNKDFFTAKIKPKPTYLGKAIPISGNGNQTNDKPITPSAKSGS